MNRDETRAAAAGAGPIAEAQSTSPPDRRAWRRTAIYTAVALVIFLGVRALPVGGGSLHYTDFRAGEKNFLEFCEPGSPQFAPVDRVHSPVTIALRPTTALRAGDPARLTATLTSGSGKPVTVDDLLVVHTEKLHFLIVDASLEDYQHVHPQPTRVPGEFAFEFTPRRAGLYRVFADFMPRATGRSLYAGARLEVAARDRAAPAAPVASRSGEQLAASRDGYRYTLTLSRRPLRINEQAEIALAVAREDGGPVVLEEIMGASAHLVAFDAGCTGFAHLHPMVAPTAAGATPVVSEAVRLNFALTLTDPGSYRLWAQVKIAGRERFVPFDLRVEP